MSVKTVMLATFVLAFLALGFAVLPVLRAADAAGGQAPTQAGERVFEMRTYHASPGKLDALHKRFRDHTLRLFEKHGITSIAYWTPIEGQKGHGEVLVFVLAYPDAAGGVHGAFAVMAALWDRELTGEVHHIDLSQLETLCLMGGPQYLATSVSGREPERRGNNSLAHAPQGVYRCRGEDEWVAVTVPDDAAWVGLVDLLESDVLRDPALGHVEARVAAQALIDAEISAWTATRDRFEVAAALQAVSVAASPAMTNADLVDSGQLADRHFIATWDQPGSGVMRYPGTPLHFASGEVEMLPAPTLGQHNGAILAELGFDGEAVAALEASDAIRDSPPY